MAQPPTTTKAGPYFTRKQITWFVALIAGAVALCVLLIVGFVVAISWDDANAKRRFEAAHPKSL